ncbi:homeobox-domain-containing protein [Heliocybe sulcata]|uniref:Homeobox-domain-containing protein n=1 Tax=Heliocybe sulcata TaxID=5364 RepID=A0A5C3NEW3_9AGAM|nr:homeobox-domain-containing protein [Heliocybe sulcata]
MDAVLVDRQAPVPLSRMSSIASTSSEDTAASSDSARRTRKRFTQEQLTRLEQLFHQCSHPTRQQREALADGTGMEIRSVTIWFQNKRQSERKVALRNSTNTHRPYSFSDTADSLKPTRTILFVPHGQSQSRPSALSRALSLDDVASRTELNIQPPSTPTRRPNPRPNATLWDSMLSSPIHSPSSPQREYQYVEFGKKKRTSSKKTLEWACAVARLASKQQQLAGGPVFALRGEPEEEDTETHCSKSSVGEMDMEDDTTDEEPHEALTPDASFAVGEEPSLAKSQKSSQIIDEVFIHDEDTMRAALALCGLGRR